VAREKMFTHFSIRLYRKYLIFQCGRVTRENESIANISVESNEKRYIKLHYIQLCKFILPRNDINANPRDFDINMILWKLVDTTHERSGLHDDNIRLSVYTRVRWNPLQISENYLHCENK